MSRPKVRTRRFALPKSVRLKLLPEEGASGRLDGGSFASNFFPTSFCRFFHPRLLPLWLRSLPLQFL